MKTFDSTINLAKFVAKGIPGALISDHVSDAPVGNFYRISIKVGAPRPWKFLFWRGTNQDSFELLDIIENQNRIRIQKKHWRQYGKALTRLAKEYEKQTGYEVKLVKVDTLYTYDS